MRRLLVLAACAAGLLGLAATQGHLTRPRLPRLTRLAGTQGLGTSPDTESSGRAEAFPTGTPTGPTRRPTPRQAAVPHLTASRDCFAAPRRCGYPDPLAGDVGPGRRCATLRRSGSITTSRSGQTIEDLDVAGTITVNQPHVTIRDVCVITNGGSQSGSVGIQVVPGARDTLIAHSRIAGLGSGSRDSLDMAVKNWSSAPATLSHDEIDNCGECIHDGPWQVDDSYVISNGMRDTGEHYEAVYYDNDVAAPGMSFDHDVLLNPEDQSGLIFSDDTTSNPTCAVNLTVKNSLLAGGGGMISFCGKTTSVGRAVMDIANNHFARCRTRPFTEATDGGTDCSGSTGTGYAAGSDRFGYWPRGGHYATNGMRYCSAPQSRWAPTNVWDDNGSFLACS